MKKVSLLILAFVFAIFVAPVLPSVNAAQERQNSVRVEESTTTVGNNKIESTGSYVKQQVRLMQDKTDEEKGKAREEVIERVKNRAELSIQNAVRRYERVKAKVNNSSLSDEAKASVNTKIDEQITAMNALQNEVRVAVSVDEVKSVMAKLKTRFKFSLGVVRQAINGVFEARLENIVENIKASYTKVSDRVDTLDDGEVKTELSGYLAEAEALIVSAEAKIESGDLVGAKKDLVSAKESLLTVIAELKGQEN